MDYGCKRCQVSFSSPVPWRDKKHKPACPKCKKRDRVRTMADYGR